MKKYITLFFSCFLFASAIYSQNRSISFDHSTFNELKEKALKENKLIFIDAYTTWCGPCKYLAKNIFTNDTVADYYNSNFINTKIDMEKGEGIEIANQYSVSCYPTLLFIDGTGNAVHRDAGSMPAKQFIEIGKTAKDPTQNFSYYMKNYDPKKSSYEFVIKYIEAIAGACMDPEEVVAHYFSLQPDDALSTEQNWNMINRFTNDADSREFNYLIDNKEKFESLYSSGKVIKKITEVAQSSLRSATTRKLYDETEYTKLKERVTQMNLPEGDKIVFESDLNRAKVNKNWTEYIKIAVANVDIYYSKDANELNTIAWNFYENITDKAALLKAEEWAKLAVDLQPGYSNLDTYASLLYKNGKKEEASATAKRAIEQAKKEGEDYEPTAKLIKKIKAM